jgi:hypothetical protein
LVVGSIVPDKEVKEMVDTTEVRKGRDESSASAVTLTDVQKEKANKAIVQAVLDQIGTDPREWFRIGWGRDAR